MYNNGEGVVKDDKQAAAWYRKAAEQGHIDAQYNLGLMYSTGEGVAQDYKLAYVWSAVAAANGDALAANNRDIFAKSLSPAALAEAQTVAGQYVEQYQPKQ
jgi:TPR repeat protein